MRQYAPTMMLGFQGDSPHRHSLHAVDAVVLGEPLVEKRPVGVQELGDREVRPPDPWENEVAPVRRWECRR